ncbi:MAG: porin family protein, partial [Terricaulis sp.]
MKSRITKTVALAALMAGAAGVANATEGWYGRADLGWSFDGEIDVSDDYQGYEFGSSTLEHDWSEHLGLGYAFQNGFRLEGELGHRFNQIEPTDTIDAGGDVHAWSAMANLFYDFNRGGSIEPYIGVGVGGARLNYNVNDHSTLNYSEGEDTVLAYQGMVGFAVGLGEQWDLDIGYRYFVADGAEGEATDTFIGSTTVVTPYTTDADYEHQALTVGLRYQFA